MPTQKYTPYHSRMDYQKSTAGTIPVIQEG
jgi:hypothetical protein